MPDQPQTPNASRISAMLQDLAAQKTGTPAAPSPSPMPQTAPPQNLPTSPVRPPAAPVGLTPPPRPVAPPPAPREPAVSVPQIPKPPTPPPAPQAPAAPPMTAPVPPPAATPAPQKPASAEVSTELRTMTADIGNLRVGQAPQGIKPQSPLPSIPSSAPTQLDRPVSPAPAQPAPVVPAMPAIPPAISAPTIVPPPVGTGTGSFRKIVYVMLGVLILGGIAYSLVSLMGGSGAEPVATATPEITAEPSPTLALKSLRTYFTAAPVTVSLPETYTITDVVAATTAAVSLQGGNATPVTLRIGTSEGRPVDIIRVIDAQIADRIESTSGTDQMMLSYGQKEHLDTANQPDPAKPVSEAYIFIVEIKDASAVSQFLTGLQNTGPTDGCTAFNQGSRAGVPITYRNCPFADNADDYAIVLASNNKNYFVMSSSRESMYFAIDQLLR